MPKLFCLKIVGSKTAVEASEVNKLKKNLIVFSIIENTFFTQTEDAEN